jgi:hypothetical protein
MDVDAYCPIILFNRNSSPSSRNHRLLQGGFTSLADPDQHEAESVVRILAELQFGEVIASSLEVFDDGFRGR